MDLVTAVSCRVCISRSLLVNACAHSCRHPVNVWELPVSILALQYQTHLNPTWRLGSSKASGFQGVWIARHLDFKASKFQGNWIPRHLDSKAYGFSFSSYSLCGRSCKVQKQKACITKHPPGGLAAPACLYSPSPRMPCAAAAASIESQRLASPPTHLQVWQLKCVWNLLQLVCLCSRSCKQSKQICFYF